jgi:hypothetical protein
MTSVEWRETARCRAMEKRDTGLHEESLHEEAAIMHGDSGDGA